MPDEWPEADCLVHDTLLARGDGARCEDQLAKRTGQRPGPATRVIALRLRADGPQ